jgi:hypothetical protein
MVFLDTETKKLIEGDLERHRMDIGWSCYWRRRGGGEKDTETWKFWEGTYPLCKYIDSLAHQKESLWIFAHNAFFDLQVSDFFYYFTKWGWVLDFVFDKGLTYILVIHKEKRSIRVVSTTNYFDTSVKELGKLTGLEKLEANFDSISRDDLSAYCRRDVEIIKRATTLYFEFIKANDLGRFSLTRASQAFNAYRHRFMNTRIYIHTNEKATALERSAYMGGRVECFRFGEQKGGPFLSLDVNSMFPYIMKNVPLPIRLIDYRSNPPLDIVEKGLNKFCMVAHVMLDTKEPLYAVRRHFKVIFPTGRFNAYVCTPLLTEAMKRGHLLKIHHLSAYEQGSLFGEYVDFFYALKQKYKEEGNAILERTAKIFLNSLYGKFAQWSSLEERIEDKTCDGYYRLETVDLVTGDTEIEYKLFNTIVRQQGKEPARNSLIAISAHITEWARFLLWQIIEGTGRDRVLYCDTDSIKMRKRDFPFVQYPVDEQRLGALRREEEFNEFTIWGAKNYITENERKIKGIPRTAEEIDEFTFKYASFPKQATHMRMRIMRHHIVEQMIKEAFPKYDKGDILSDGSTRPYVLNEV